MKPKELRKAWNPLQGIQIGTNGSEVVVRHASKMTPQSIQIGADDGPMMALDDFLKSAHSYTATLPARICLQIQIEAEQLKRLQASYALHMSRRDGTRLRWLENAIDQEQDKVRMLYALRSAECPSDCPQQHGLECTDPENGRCLWNDFIARHG